MQDEAGSTLFLLDKDHEIQKTYRYDAFGIIFMLCLNVKTEPGSSSEENFNLVKPEAAVTGSKKHGINWKDGPARAKATGNPQGQWAKSDLDYATKMANTLKPGESACFNLPEGSKSIVHMPDGSTQPATQMWIRNNGTSTWHGYPMR